MISSPSQPTTDRSPLERQQALASLLPHPCLVAVSTGSVQSTQGAQYAPFRPHSHAYYLTSLAEPEVVLFLYLSGEGNLERAIVIQDPPAAQRVWSDTYQLTTASPSLQEYCHIFSWQQPAAIASWLDLLPANLPIMSLDLNNQARQILPQHESNNCLLEALAQLRSYKEPAEITLMQKAAMISSQAHAHLKRFWPDNEGQWELLWRSYCFEQGARQQAYLPIIAGGARSCCLHYHSNNKDTASCQWILVDAGAEWDYYASDITRTYFKGCQGTMVETIYRHLLDLQKRLCAAVRPGVSLERLEQQARKEMAQWLVAWGWVSEDTEDVIAETKKYFPHRLGHQLGLDVHDNSSIIRSDTVLKPSMVITIEPGFYCSPLLLPEGSPCLGLGIRIEDDILVTQEGHIVLSQGAPKEWEEVCFD